MLSRAALLDDGLVPVRLPGSQQFLGQVSHHKLLDEPPFTLSDLQVLVQF